MWRLDFKPGGSRNLKKGGAQTEKYDLEILKSGGTSQKYFNYKNQKF